MTGDVAELAARFGAVRAVQAAWRLLATALVMGSAVLLWLSMAQAHAQSSLPPLVQAGAVPAPGWRVVGVPKQAMPFTRYNAALVEGRVALRIEARASYANLVHELQSAAPPRMLRWTWRVEQANPLADLQTRAGDDSAAKVCLSFDLPLQQVPLVERTLLRLARARSGENLPAATLCWVWAGREAPGALITNAYTGRVRYIVLRNAQDATGVWLDESRDVAADFKRAFGQESATLPALSAVIVAGDADNTGATSIALVADLRLEP